MKIQKVDRHIGMTIAGGVADAQNLVDVMRYNANIYRISNREVMPVSSVQDSVLMYYSIKDTFHIMSRLFWLDMTIKEVNNIYNINLFGSMTTEKFISTGSGSPVAYGYL